MALDPALFRDYPDLSKGDRVRYVMASGREGEGVVSLIWLGIAEMCRVEHDDGSIQQICRELGDKITRCDTDGGPS